MKPNNMDSRDSPGVLRYVDAKGRKQGISSVWGQLLGVQGRKHTHEHRAAGTNNKVKN
jgi:hypothetical protein